MPIRSERGRIESPTYRIVIELQRGQLRRASPSRFGVNVEVNPMNAAVPGCEVMVRSANAKPVKEL
jgi:transposase